MSQKGGAKEALARSEQELRLLGGDNSDIGVETWGRTSNANLSHVGLSLSMYSAQ
jgi:hypothetical protein